MAKPSSPSNPSSLHRRIEHLASQEAGEHVAGERIQDILSELRAAACEMLFQARTIESTLLGSPQAQNAQNVQSKDPEPPPPNISSDLHALGGTLREIGWSLDRVVAGL